MVAHSLRIQQYGSSHFTCTVKRQRTV